MLVRPEQPENVLPKLVTFIFLSNKPIGIFVKPEQSLNIPLKFVTFVLLLNKPDGMLVRLSHL